MQTTPATEGARPGQDIPDLRLFVFALFFIFGGITSLNDVLIPKLKQLFTLSYAEVMMVQFAFFAAYLVDLHSGRRDRQAGGLYARRRHRASYHDDGLPAVHSRLACPPSSSCSFWRCSCLPSGITVIQVVTNPLISILGTPETAHSRLTFAQAFNSLGTTIFPFVGSILILGSLAKTDPATLSGAALDAFRRTETQMVILTYLGLAMALAILAALVWWRRKRLIETVSEHAAIFKMFNLLSRARFAFGAACIFLYVGAEVSIGSVIVNYLMQAGTLGLPAEDRGQACALLLGRGAGGPLHRRLCAEICLTGKSPGLQCGHGGAVAADLRQYGWRGVGLVAARHWALQLHHVSHHLRAGLRRAWARAPRTARA